MRQGIERYRDKRYRDIEKREKEIEEGKLQEGNMTVPPWQKEITMPIAKKS